MPRAAEIPGRAFPRRRLARSAGDRRRAPPPARAWEFARLVVLLALVPGCSGCDESPPRPWEKPEGEAERSPLFVGGSGGGSLARASRALPPPEASGTASAREVLPPLPFGAPWVRCHEDFRPSGDPQKDVVRLATLCGPATGMARLEGAEASGEAGPGSPLGFSFEARAGECFRVFAVGRGAGGGPEPDLDVVVRTRRGSAVASDHGEGSWPIVQPDRPFCTTRDETFEVEIASPGGPVRVAAETWRLPARRADVDVARKGR